jgi:hypothetical protein
MALRRYARDIIADCAPVEFPRFRCAEVRPTRVADVGLSLDAATHRALEDEAPRQKVPLEQLITHAVLVCFAHVDRATELEAN